MSVEYDCILWEYRTGVLKKLQQSVLNELHRSHMDLDKDIEKMVKNCIHCQEISSSPEKCPLMPWEPTQSAWRRIQIDFAGPINNYYL